MNIIDIIAKKRDNKELCEKEIEFFINEYTKGNITDYQAAALIMAIYINGMNEKEVTSLTMEMAKSGDILNLNDLDGITVDKHSTGGVGDKITLILMPVIASLGVPVAKMSGKGLGFTGGTIDKLESIPGYNTNMDINSFIENVKKIGISLIGQTLNLAPADKKIYALRDTIACTESIALIASSIMSKKIAAGAQKIVLDVTVGSGAFMKDEGRARELARLMIKIGKLAGRETICVLTNMDEPLGYAVGNNLEVKEAIKALKGDMCDDVKKVVFELGSYMLYLSGKSDDIEENKKMILENINNGKAYSKFLELVENQGGDISYIENIEKFEKAKYIKEVKSKKQGYIKKIDAEEVGRLSSFLGAGRMKKEDSIDYSVGIEVYKKVGDYINIGDVIGTIYSNDENKLIEAERKLYDMYLISEEYVSKNKTIIEVIK